VKVVGSLAARPGYLREIIVSRPAMSFAVSAVSVPASIADSICVLPPTADCARSRQ